MKKDVIDQIIKNKVIAIVRGYSIEECLKLAGALHKGGINMMEVTFPQTSIEEQKYTAETIKVLKKEMGDCMEFGAGTVTSVEMVRMAHEAGATFIISPDMDVDVIKETLNLGMVSIPGAFTPTEIKQACKAGADFVKVFPADHVAPSYFKAVKAPLSQARMLAVGGINEKNVLDYFANGACGAGVASCLFKKDWIKAGEWEKITKASEQFLSVIKENA